MRGSRRLSGACWLVLRGRFGPAKKCSYTQRRKGRGLLVLLLLLLGELLRLRGKLLRLLLLLLLRRLRVLLRLLRVLLRRLLLLLLLANLLRLLSKLLLLRRLRVLLRLLRVLLLRRLLLLLGKLLRLLLLLLRRLRKLLRLLVVRGRGLLDLLLLVHLQLQELDVLPLADNLAEDVVQVLVRHDALKTTRNDDEIGLRGPISLQLFSSLFFQTITIIGTTVGTHKVCHTAGRARVGWEMREQCSNNVDAAEPWTGR